MARLPLADVAVVASADLAWEFTSLHVVAGFKLFFREGLIRHCFLSCVPGQHLRVIRLFGIFTCRICLLILRSFELSVNAPTFGETSSFARLFACLQLLQ